MNGILWTLQALLALLFLSSGVAKSHMSKERMLATGQTGAAAMLLGSVRFIAICEIVGAVGLVAPWALGMHPMFSCCRGFAIIIVGAAIVHYRIHESKPIVVNAVLLHFPHCHAV